MTTAKTLPEAFQATATKFATHIALRTPDGRSYTWAEYAAAVAEYAAIFTGMGVSSGDAVAIMLTNRPEFHFADTAVLHLGATPFSIYNTSSPEQLRFILRDSNAVAAVFENKFAENLIPAAREYGIPALSVDEPTDDAPSVGRLSSTSQAGFDFVQQWKTVRADQLATLIYTSGTTGAPKGVELTHTNILAEVEATQAFLPVGPEDRIISFLPSAHVADRWLSHYLQIVYGTQLTCLADQKQLLHMLKTVRPTVFGAVPQVWQKIRHGIGRLAETSGDATLLVAYQAAQRSAEGESGTETTAALAAAAPVFGGIRAALGLDALRLSISGAAPLAPETLRFFHAIGIPVTDGWGMSELSGLTIMSPPDEVRLGRIGKPLPGIEIALAEDGELKIRGPVVMRGYRNQPGKTAETIDNEGWLATGDIATVDEDGYVAVVDRKKELIINASGKNMSPASIESLIKAESPLIAHAVAIGNDRKYNVALIVLDKEFATSYGTSIGIDTELDTLAENRAVRDQVSSAIERANGKLSRVEQIKKHWIVREYWEPGSDMLTPTMKLRRQPIATRYKAKIADLYDD